MPNRWERSHRGDVSRTVLPFLSIQLPWRNGAYVYAFVLRVGKLRDFCLLARSCLLAVCLTAETPGQSSSFDRAT